jgi:hypothetical protein
LSTRDGPSRIEIVSFEARPETAHPCGSHADEHRSHDSESSIETASLEEEM